MPISLKIIRDRIRLLLRDTDDKNPSFVSSEYDQWISEAYLQLQTRLPPPQLLSSNAFTITGGSDTFTLPSTVTGYASAEYAGDVRIQLRSNNRFLVKRTVEEIDSLRNLVPLTYLGVPYSFCLWEDSGQLVNGRSYPGAKADEPCNLFVALAPSDLRDYVGGGTSTLDDVNVLFSRYASSALVFYTASEIVMRMPEEDLKLRRLNPNVAALWRKDADVALYQEEVRRHDIAGTGRTQRWVP